MTDSRCFVQFSHPGSEHEPDRGRWKAWNSYRYPHRRKFMELRGEWVGAGDSRQAGDLRAWCEWEPESDLVCTFSPREGESRSPRFLWHPYYVPKASYRELHNTDPFVFGEHFLYSNCGQSSKPGLRHLDEGSVIAFGSGTNVAGERRWMLDTVLVVRDFVDYDPRRACAMLEDCTPAAFLIATGGPPDRQRRRAAPEYVCADADTAPALPRSNPLRSGRRDVQLLPRNSGRW